jgi:hypothetical protein
MTKPKKPKPKKSKAMFSLERSHGGNDFEDEPKGDISATVMVRTSGLVQMITNECRKAMKPSPGKERILAILHEVQELELAVAVDELMTKGIDRPHEMTVKRLEALRDWLSREA